MVPPIITKTSHLEYAETGDNIQESTHLSYKKKELIPRCTTHFEQTFILVFFFFKELNTAQPRFI